MLNSGYCKDDNRLRYEIGKYFNVTTYGIPNFLLSLNTLTFVW